MINRKSNIRINNKPKSNNKEVKGLDRRANKNPC